MNQPAAEEIKKTHDDLLAFRSLDPVTFLEVRDERRIYTKGLDFLYYLRL